jgi:hypothetical protein
VRNRDLQLRNVATADNLIIANSHNASNSPGKSNEFHAVSCISAAVCRICPEAGVSLDSC